MTVFGATGITAKYGQVTVLDQVDLPTLNDNEVLGLLGPNASGKSTLMRCLSGEKSTTGHITIDGRTRAEMGHDGWHHRLASMPQSPPNPSALLPTELMWSTARALDLDVSDRELADQIEGIFARLGLSEFALSPLHTLSGGKRQLVGLALALMRDPDVLLLDEPTSALDLHWRMVVLDLVRERLSDRGGVVVAALHDLDLAARYCDQIVLLHGGKIIASGDPQHVLTPANLARVYRVETRVTLDCDGRPLVQVIRPLRDGEAA
ncbi:ABC transporter ATP-binding protein [Thalassospira povalilytica]|uniref:ABC transporter ATP-binding protein n=1 Tax=Thalassospira povalilytica TaxID=732237 RepID=UPI003AA962CB